MIYKLLKTFLITCLFYPQAQAEVFQSQHHQFEVTPLIKRLDHPWGMAFIDTEKLLITERSGNLLLANLATEQTIKVQGLPSIKQHGQGGLLDVVIHPNFDENRLVYLSFAQSENGLYGSEVLRAKFDGQQLINPEIIFQAKPKVKGTRHFGSRLAIDQQGHLFISLGDRGIKDSAQDLQSHLGSLIRLHDDGRIPIDNPFLENKKAKPEIYSYGHRNIQGLTIHPKNQRLWLHEHGPQGGDELNLPQAGLNYGWPIITYGVNYFSGTKIGEGSHKPGMQQPVHHWTPSIAPSGMAFYLADQFENWQNNLFVGSLKFSQLVRLEINDNKVTHQEKLLTNEFGRIRDVAQGPDGFLYLLTDERKGQLLRLSPAKP